MSTHDDFSCDPRRWSFAKLARERRNGMPAVVAEWRLRTSEEPFVVEGVSEDASRTMLFEHGSYSEAVAWVRRYVRTENAGGWDLIEVYDTRGETPERIWLWERGN